MKIIHCADIHLGAKIDSRFPKEVAEERRREVRNSFSRMVRYAVENGVRGILFCGDVFDRDKPFKQDSNLFYEAVKSNPDIEFFYLRGNHDEEGGIEELPPNLKLFSTEWTQYTLEGVTVSGIELAKENKRSYYTTLSLNGGNRNIVMLHGQVGEEILLNKLQDKGIDYLALGHIHTQTIADLDGRGKYAYSGCLEGRGFDETGVKGFILLDVEEGSGKITPTFVPFSKRAIEKYSVDVSTCRGAFAMSEKVRKEVPFQTKNIYRVELIGEVEIEEEEFAADVERYLCAECAYLSIKDCTKKKLHYERYAEDKTLRGEFVRTVLQSTDYTDEEKAQMIAYGLKALAGREVDA